jgi:hypothetical protein
LLAQGLGEMLEAARTDARKGRGSIGVVREGEGPGDDSLTLVLGEMLETAPTDARKGPGSLNVVREGEGPGDDSLVLVLGEMLQTAPTDAPKGPGSVLVREGEDPVDDPGDDSLTQALGEMLKAAVTDAVKGRGEGGPFGLAQGSNETVKAAFFLPSTTRERVTLEDVPDVVTRES